MLNENKYIFLDIDGVLATLRQYYSNNRKWHKEFKVYNFDKKCVNVLNAIMEETNAIIILSSDWRINYDLEIMNRIFQYNNVKAVINDFTEDFWGDRSLNKAMRYDLAKCRANEINKYIVDNNISTYVVIDDLDMNEWFPNNFVCTEDHQGIKKSNVKEKIIKILNNE